MKAIIVYDISTLPEVGSIGPTALEIVNEVYEKKGIILWDSQAQSIGENVFEPKVYNIPEGTEISVVDVRSEEGQELLKEATDGK